MNITEHGRRPGQRFWGCCVLREKDHSTANIDGFSRLDPTRAEDCEVPAAFFLVGSYIEDNPDLVKRMAEEGHVVGNHTMTHPDMSAIADAESFEKELTGVEEAYEKAMAAAVEKPIVTEETPVEDAITEVQPIVTQQPATERTEHVNVLDDGTITSKKNCRDIRP